MFVFPCAEIPDPEIVGMRSTTGVTIEVGSLEVLFARLVSPAVVTVAVLTTLEGASGATFTFTVIVSAGALTWREPVRVQVRVASTQFHAIPLIEVAVRPAGSVSVTVIVPFVGAVPTFCTSMKYVPVPPRAKGWKWLFLIARSGTGGCTMSVRSCVRSFAVLTSPPPETVTVFSVLAGASNATFTVSVIVG